MAKLPNRLVIEITNTDKVDELGNPIIGFESNDYAECVIEELEKIKAKIDFEEKWLKNIKMENGFISIADIEVALSGIRSVISELKEEQEIEKVNCDKTDCNNCINHNYCDYEYPN